MPNRRSDDAPGRGTPPPTRESATDLPPDLPKELPHTFLGLDERAAAWSTARVVVLPVPWEATTSYGGGARAGPRAILEASRYVELYDQELDADPSTVGVHTLEALELTREGPPEAMAELGAAYRRLLDAAGERFVIMLGGEHSVSSPAIRAWSERTDSRLSVLQMDAHADLRASYEGSLHSHASAMARVLDCADVVGVGVRALSTDEAEVAASAAGVTLVYAEEMQDEAWIERALEALGDPIYLTIDVDYFDPSLVPSTGTPEPGGGVWYSTLRFLRRVFAERTVLACDVVELAPVPGLHAPDFLVAKLVYKLIGYRFQGQI